MTTAIRAALTESKTPLEAPAAPVAPAVELDIGQLDRIRRGEGKGEWRGGASPRSGPRRRNGTRPSRSDGIATSINFQPTGGGKAAVTGDFVLTAEEVNPVVKTLRESGIEVTPIRSHMLTEAAESLFYALLGQR